MEVAKPFAMQIMTMEMVLRAIASSMIRSSSSSQQYGLEVYHVDLKIRLTNWNVGICAFVSVLKQSGYCVVRWHADGN